MSRYIDTVLKENILPVALKLPGGVPPCTTFYFTEEDSLHSVMRETIRRDCPTLFRDKETLLRAVSSMYDKIVRLE